MTRGYHVMAGYYKNEEETNATIDEDGWLHTGDIGIMDEDGYFQVTGRMKDMVIRGGENIYPRRLKNSSLHIRMCWMFKSSVYQIQNTVKS